MSNWWDLCGAQVLEVFTPWGTLRHLKVWRHDGQDGIAWDTLQAVKDEMLGADVCAVEVYPAASDVVNEVNYRHLWEVPSDHALPFGLHLSRRT